MLREYVEIAASGCCTTSPRDSIPVCWTLTDADDELINYAGTARLLITQTRIPIYSLFLAYTYIMTFIFTTHQIIPHLHASNMHTHIRIPSKHILICMYNIIRYTTILSDLSFLIRTTLMRGLDYLNLIFRY